MAVITRERLEEISALVDEEWLWEGPTRDAMAELLDECNTLLEERSRLFEAVRRASVGVANDALLSGDVRSAERRLERIQAALRGAGRQTKGSEVATTDRVTQQQEDRSRRMRGQGRGVETSTEPRDVPRLILISSIHSSGVVLPRTY